MSGNEPVVAIGVTGLPGAGKGEFIEFLRATLNEHGVPMRYYSLSQELREEAQSRGEPVERPVLRRIANELRNEFGNGVLSQIVARKIRRELDDRPETRPFVVVVDAIRTPEEVDVLRQELQPTFVLVALEAPLEVLVERIAARARFDESEEVMSRREAARNMLLGEAGHDEPPYGHNVAACISMADYRIDNSEDLETLSQATKAFAEERILSLLRDDD